MRNLSRSKEARESELASVSDPDLELDPTSDGPSVSACLFEFDRAMRRKPVDARRSISLRREFEDTEPAGDEGGSRRVGSVDGPGCERRGLDGLEWPLSWCCVFCMNIRQSDC